MDCGDSVLTVNGAHHSSARRYQQPENVSHNLIAGGVAGSAGILVGHPLDSYKVRLQTNTTSTALTSLFRGIGPPVATAAIVNALIFVSYAQSSRLWDQQQDRFPQDSALQPFACGCFTGLVSSLVLAPSELLKCRLQVHASTSMSTTGALNVMRDIVARHGMLGMYRGFAATCLRQSPSFGIYFASYDHIKELLCRKLSIVATNTSSPTRQSSVLLAASALAGGLAGSLAWAVVYPMDVIKSRIQCLPLDTPTGSMRIHSVAQSIWRSGGWNALYRGVGITVLRAFPVNGIIFPVYEFCLQQLGKETDPLSETHNTSIRTGTLISFPNINR
jgi:solute carrier family 25 (mitochondrial carnitine/acylcarnitine transporter), member 20/29